MNVKQQDRFIAHCSRYFGQEDPKIFHPNENFTPHVDILCYPPNEAYPFWKLVTMGASDYKMPAAPHSLGRRNEYMMFVDMDINLMRSDVGPWYLEHLMTIASYGRIMNTHIGYGHSMQWETEEDTDMVGCFLEMPQIVEDAGFLWCKLSPFKKITCLQAVLLTQEELDFLLDIGPERFSNFLYPQENIPCHYLSQQYRSEKF